jgi:hypothetical protein
MFEALGSQIFFLKSRANQQHSGYRHILDDNGGAAVQWVSVSAHPEVLMSIPHKLDLKGEKAVYGVAQLTRQTEEVQALIGNDDY